MPIPLGILAAAGFRPPTAAGAYELIETITVGAGGAASVTFSNLNTYSTTYQHLQIRMVGKTSRGTFQDDPIVIQFNGDTNAANYKYHKLATTGGSTPLSETEPYTFTLASSLLDTNIFGAIVSDILDPYEAKNKTVRSLGGVAGTIVGLNSSVWFNTAAVSTIRVASYTGSTILQRSRFSIYGLKGTN